MGTVVAYYDWLSGFMAEPTLLDVFGAGASQSSTTLTINKADLAAVGLTASSTNTAESLVAALVLQFKGSLTQTALEANPDQSIYIAASFNSIIQRPDANGNQIETRQNQLAINFLTPSPSVISPDSY